MFAQCALQRPLNVDLKVLEACAGNTEEEVDEEELDEDGVQGGAAGAQCTAAAQSAHRLVAEAAVAPPEQPKAAGLARSIFGKDTPAAMDIWHDDLVAVGGLRLARGADGWGYRKC